jgi:hypothetical protein
MAQEKKRRNGPWSWTKEEVKLLKKLYPRGDTKSVAERLGRPLTAVRQRAYDLGMKTDAYQFWSEDDLKLLAELYPNTAASELAKRFGRNIGTVKAKALQLGIKKSQGFIKFIKSRRRRGKSKTT